MHDVAWHQEVNCVRSKDAQKQLARTSLSKTLSWWCSWREDQSVVSLATTLCLLVNVGFYRQFGRFPRESPFLFLALWVFGVFSFSTFLEFMDSLFRRVDFRYDLDFCTTFKNSARSHFRFSIVPQQIAIMLCQGLPYRTFRDFVCFLSCPNSRTRFFQCSEPFLVFQFPLFSFIS